MSDATYDAIIIGAGHNGMALGAYLAKAGLRVAIFEKRTEEGGALCTEELTRPGFLHNVHANYHTLVGICPVYDDLELITRHGLRYVAPETQMASIFDDGSALVVHTDLNKTCESIARFSRKDADTFRSVYEEARGYRDIILRTLMYSPPVSLLDITKALVTWGVEKKSKFLSVHLRNQTINQFLDDNFENDRVKAHLSFHAALAGYATDRKGLAVSFPLLLSKIDNWHVCIGGSHALAHSLWEAFAQAGGRVFLNHGVDKILLENGKAVGVRLEDGSEVRAPVIASSISLEQTFLRMVGRENLSAPLKEEVERYQHMDWTFFSVHLAMTRAPQYRAASFDPDVNKAWVVNLGYESPAQFNHDWKAVRAGQLLDPRPNAAVNSLYDPTDAPDGCYTGLLRQIAPFNLASGGAQAWDKVGREYGRRCIEVWKAAAPNLSDDSFIEWAAYTPLDIARRMPNMVQADWIGGLIDLSNMLDQRPGPILSDYRTPILGLYMCGATQHPHGFVTFAPAYNALETIARDQKIEPWWK